MTHSAFYFGWALAFIAPVAHAIGKIEPPKQKGTIQCSKSLNLKDVFDAGFRPYRVTESWCSVGKADLSLVLLPSNISVPLDVETISFSVSRYDTVKRMELSTPARSVKQTGEVLRQLAGGLGVSLKGLDEALARATPSNPKWSDTE